MPSQAANSPQSAEIRPAETLPFAFALDTGIAARARIGLIVLATDHTLEYECRRIFRLPGVALYGTRIRNEAAINPTTLAAMEAGLAPAAALILPGTPLDVIGYGCTSASVVMGSAKVAARIAEARPEAKITDPIAAAIAGLRALGARRIALLTPYIDSVNQRFRAYIEQQGLVVSVIGSFLHEDDNEVARISTASIRQAALALGRRKDVEAVFVSCTSLRVVEIAAELEAEMGKPVTSSNHALAWHCLRLAGIDDKFPDLGRLFRI